MNSTSDLKKIRAQFDRAIKTRNSGDVDSARKSIKELLQSFEVLHEPASRKLYAELWYELGVCQHMGRNTKNARVSFERAYDSDREATPAALRLVEYKIDSEGAMSNNMVPLYFVYLKEGADKNIRHGTLRRLQQILRIRLTERPAVVVWRMEMLEKLTKVVPELKFPKLYLGRGHYLREHYDKAIEILSKLRETAGQSHNVLNMLARSHEKLGDLDAAYRLYDKSLKTTPGQSGVHFRLGRLDLKLSEL